MNRTSAWFRISINPRVTRVFWFRGKTRWGSAFRLCPAESMHELQPLAFAEEKALINPAFSLAAFAIPLPKPFPKRPQRREYVLRRIDLRGTLLQPRNGRPQSAFDRGLPF